ncbi:MAG: hypothetical protein FJZ98_09085 [Chloroflexi bacterium]|nr:hypothetical protein [Chloroflexota bacterium]
MKPKERVIMALSGSLPDKIPFTTYWNKYFVGEVERELRNQGMCIIDYRVPVFTIETPDISEETLHYRGSDGLRHMRRILKTPRGTISEDSKMLPEHPRIPGHLQPWISEHMFKGPENYPAIEFMIRNRGYKPNYEAFENAQKEAGGDILLIPDLGLTPLQEIIILIMGIETFSVEWHYRRAEVLKLYEALTENQRQYYPIVAESPAITVSGDANIVPDILGLDRFRKYVLPHHNELGGLLHAHGKFLQVHFDANTKLLAADIAESEVDIIEALTPSPYSDMSIREARNAWPNKVLWINFPSSAHTDPPEIVEETTRHILRESSPGGKFLIGITEVFPPDRWQASYSAISRVINRDGLLPLNL